MTSTSPASFRSPMMRGWTSKSPSAPDHAQAALLHGCEMRTAREEGHVLAGLRHARADIAADGACAGDQKSALPHAPRQRLRHRAALDFAGRGARNRLDDVQLLGTLEIGQALLAERQDRGFGLRLRLQDHGGGDFFAPGGMRNAERNSFGDCGMAQQNFVDFTRRDLFAAAIDQFLDAAGEREIAVGIEKALIAGAEPAVGETTSRWLRDCSRSRRPRWGLGSPLRRARPSADDCPAASMMPILTPVPGPTEPGLRAAGGCGFEHIWCDASVMP